MNIFSRYLIRYVFIGFAAAAGILLPLFTTFNLINELDDVSPGGYRWSQAVIVVLMTLPRNLIDLSPFIALLGGIAGLGHLSKTMELTAIRSTGLSIFKIAMITLTAGVMIIALLAVTDEWIAAPLQQHALRIRTTAMAQDPNADHQKNNMLWARRGDAFATIKSLDAKNQPVGIEIFHYRPDLSLETYIYAEKGRVLKNGTWTLEGVYEKRWLDGRETTEVHKQQQWKSIFTRINLEMLTMPAGSFSIKQLRSYISYLQDTGQPSIEFRVALWQKLGRPLLTLAMMLLAIPFTFSIPRSPGIGSRLAMGVIVGLLTYISDQIIVNIGILFDLQVQLTVLCPPVALLIIALILVSRFNRQE